MASSDRWTRLQLRTAVRRELLDPNERWWTTDELNIFIQGWEDYVQDQLELVWGTATAAVGVGTATLTLTNIAADILRPDAVYWNNTRLAPRTKGELDVYKRDWRTVNPNTPVVAYQDDHRTLSFWPSPDVAGTAVFEYPAALDFITDTSTMELPAWTRYSAKNYCAWQAYQRPGPNQDPKRAARYRGKFLRQLARYSTLKANMLPDKALTLRPGGAYERDILDPLNSRWDLL